MKFLLLLLLSISSLAVSRAMTVAEYLAIRYDAAIDNAARFPALEQQFVTEAINIEILASQLRPAFNQTYSGPELAAFLALFPPSPVPPLVPAAVCPAPAPAQVAKPQQVIAPPVPPPAPVATPSVQRPTFLKPYLRR